VTPTPTAASLNLAEAAAFLGIHGDTLRERAASGIIPGAKIGKEWRFLDVDLAKYLREQYACHSTNNLEVKSGTSTLATAASALDDHWQIRSTGSPAHP
jgi:excisionase family DNA binding protein